MHTFIKRGIALVAALAMALPVGMPTTAFAATTAETLGATTTIEDGASYRLVSAVNTKLSVTVSSGSRMPQAELVNETDGRGEHHIFIAKKNSDGTYRLITQNSDMAVEVKNGSPKNGVRIQASYENTEKYQNWKLIKNNDGSFTVKNAKTGTVLDVAGGSKKGGTRIQAYQANGTTAQKFYFVKTSATPHTYSGFYEIASAKNQDFIINMVDSLANNPRTSGREVLGDDANAMIFADRVHVRYARLSGAGNLRVLYSGNGYYRIQNIKTFDVLDVAGGSDKNGANVRPYQWNGTGAQLWKIVDNGDGTVTFLNKKSGKALDISGGIMKDGRNIQQYTPNGTSAQKWVLDKQGGQIHYSKLEIPSIGFNMTVKWLSSTKGAQDVIDSQRMCAGFPYGSSTVISQHVTSQFYLDRVPAGAKAYIKEGTCVREYVCVANFSGHNTGTQLTDARGTDVDKMYKNTLFMYTCESARNPENVTITVWEPV